MVQRRRMVATKAPRPLVKPMHSQGVSGLIKYTSKFFFCRIPSCCCDMELHIPVPWPFPSDVDEQAGSD